MTCLYCESTWYCTYFSCSKFTNDGVFIVCTCCDKQMVLLYRIQIHCSFAVERNKIESSSCGHIQFTTSESKLFSPLTLHENKRCRHPVYNYKKSRYEAGLNNNVCLDHLRDAAQSFLQNLPSAEHLPTCQPPGRL